MEEQRNQCPGVPIRQSSGRSRSEHLKLRHQNKDKKQAPATFQMQALPSVGVLPHSVHFHLEQDI